MGTTQETIQVELLPPVAVEAPLPNKDIFIVYDDLDLSSLGTVGNQVLNTITEQLNIKTGTRSQIATQISYTLTIQLILQALENLDSAVLDEIENTLISNNIDARVLTTVTGIRTCPQGSKLIVNSQYKLKLRMEIAFRRAQRISLHAHCGLCSDHVRCFNDDR